MLDYFRKNFYSMMSLQKTWVQLMGLVILCWAMFVITGKFKAAVLAYIFALMVGYFPWTFKFAPASIFERIAMNKWFTYLTVGGGIIYLATIYTSPGQAWQRLLMILMLGYVMNPEWRCIGYKEKAQNPKVG
ncbi:hypothetical protein H8F21_13855 [Pseudomonas sp. P66]|uniref:Uncharacterized protein n=1 Tax=Pseudomonas arcuscaelestis TaxID=2710591 RepID=A0ABS2BYU2_9PSED|nr:hypothetical protein [Pseudomonas arcuscaelestis]MBM5458650.1 hypothetical protein [Pseudomonas arcuscaelestis]